MKRETIAAIRAAQAQENRRVDLLGFAEVARFLLADGIRHGRACDDIVKDLATAALARPTISEDIHQAYLAAKATAKPHDQKGT